MLIKIQFFIRKLKGANKNFKLKPSDTELSLEKREISSFLCRKSRYIYVVEPLNPPLSCYNMTLPKLYHQYWNRNIHVTIFSTIVQILLKTGIYESLLFSYISEGSSGKPFLTSAVR